MESGAANKAQLQNRHAYYALLESGADPAPPLEPTHVLQPCGENGAGWSRLVVKNGAPAGVRISLAHTEMRDRLGKDIFNQFPCFVDTRVCVNQTDQYITAGKG